MLQLPRIWPVGTHCELVPVFFWHISGILVSTSLLPGTTKYSRFIITSPAPALESGISARSPGSSQLEMIFKNQNQGARCAFTIQ